MNFKLLLLAFLASLSLNAQVFVNSGATGANNGSSWANAYTSLSSAIANAPANTQLWIAAGTYKPGATRNDFFDIQNGIKLYGGFAGNESALSQRDFNSNLTILSGDIAGNDIPNDFSSNKTDNSRHIVWIQNALNDAVTFDGLVFEGGHTDDGSGSGNDRRGGAILTYSRIAVKNCTFRQNYGYFGGVYPRQAGANNSTFEDCLFTNNDGEFGAGLFLASTVATIENCTFSNNSVSSNGGGLCTTNSAYTLSNSTFSNNSATEGGAILTNSSQGGTHICSISNTDFLQNTATFGGAIESYHQGIEIDFDNCTFDGNTAVSRGGGIAIESGSIGRFNNCTFQNNIAQDGAGISMATNTSARVENSTFVNNSGSSAGTGSGGGILFSNSSLLEVIKSTFDNNSSYNGGGIFSDHTVAGSTLRISKSIFTNNSANNFGGGIGSINGILEIVDCLIADNTATATGGGVFIGSAGLNGTSTISSTTIANNNAASAGGISQAINSGTLSLELKNTILENTPANYVNNSPSGTPTTTSTGGNLSSDATLSSVFTATNDLNNTSANFEDAGAGDYHLATGSPAIDKAVGTVSPTDLDGLARVNTPDIGAYEYQGPSNNSDLVLHNNAIKVFPNPVNESLNFSLENKWSGELQIRITDSKGALVYHQNIEKDHIDLQQSINVSNLASGTYQLSINKGAAFEVRSFLIFNQ